MRRRRPKAHGEARTRNLRIRGPTLCPIELRGRFLGEAVTPCASFKTSHFPSCGARYPTAGERLANFPAT